MKLEDVMLTYGADFQRLHAPREEIIGLVKEGEAGIEAYLAGKYFNRAITGFFSGITTTGITAALSGFLYAIAVKAGTDTLSGKIFAGGFLFGAAVSSLLAVGTIKEPLTDFGKYLKYKHNAGDKNGN